MMQADRGGVGQAAAPAGTLVLEAKSDPLDRRVLLMGAAALAPLVSHRVLEVLSMSWNAPPWNLVALHLLPPMSMLALGALLWRVVPPLYLGDAKPGERPGYRGLCIAAGLLLGAMAAAANLLSMLASAGDGVPATAAMGLSPASAALVAHVMVLAPLAEEVAFRGMLYRYLRHMVTPLAATFASALLFALMHASLAQCVWAMVLGLVAAVAYEHTRSLLTPIIIHGLFNSVPIGVAVVRSNPSDTGPIWLIICVVAGIFTLAARAAGQGDPSTWE